MLQIDGDLYKINGVVNGDAVALGMPIPPAGRDDTDDAPAGHFAALEGAGTEIGLPSLDAALQSMKATAYELRTLDRATALIRRDLRGLAEHVGKMREAVNPDLRPEVQATRAREVFEAMRPALESLGADAVADAQQSHLSIARAVAAALTPPPAKGEALIAQHLDAREVREWVASLPAGERQAAAMRAAGVGNVGVLAALAGDPCGRALIAEDTLRRARAACLVAVGGAGLLTLLARSGEALQKAAVAAELAAGQTYNALPGKSHLPAWKPTAGRAEPFLSAADRLARVTV